MPPGKSALDLFEKAREQKISVAPGPIFSAKPRFGTSLRISCGFPWSDRIDRAIRTLGRIAHEL
jgi:DNA-binding transcriptional MocR family regulator